MYTKRLLCLVLVVSSLLGLLLVACAKPVPAPTAPVPAPTTPVPAPTKVFELSVVCHFKPEHIRAVALADTLKLAEEFSGGRLKFKFYPGGQLVAGTEQLDFVRKGSADMALIYAGWHAGVMPFVADACAVPAGWSPYRLLEAVYDGGMDKLLTPIYEKYGVKPLSYMTTSAYQYFSRVPINSLKDFQGKLCRGMGGLIDVHNQMLGMSLVPVDTAETYTALQRGTIDVVEQTVETALSIVLYEPGPYVLLADAGSVYNTTIIQLDKWKSLPPDLQSALSSAAQIASYRLLDRARGMDDKNLAAFKAKPGVKVSYLSDEERAKWFAMLKEKLWPKQVEKYGEQWTQLMAIIEKYR